jgi:hypothetical protein
MAKKNKEALVPESTFPKLDKYFNKKQDTYFYLSMALLVLFNILLFDVRISVGGDDSGYLLNAKKFIEGETFPNYHGAFYTMMIGWVMQLIGFKLVVFKMMSMLFLLGHQAFLYYALKDRVSSFILVATLLISSVCSGLIYYGSQTYSEAFFIMLQGAFLYIVFKYLIDVPNDFKHVKVSWPSYLAAGAVMLMIYTTRNVGIVTLLTLLLYYLITKRYKPALLTYVFYQVFAFPYGLYKKIAWEIEKSDMAGQLEIIQQKHPYNKALGTEDFSGIVTRVIENLKNYLSKILPQQLGLKDLANNDTSLFLAIVIVLVLLVGLILAFRSKDKTLKFLLLYLGMGLGVTFIALHQMWAQTRMIIIYIPLLLITLAWTFAAISKFNKLGLLKYVPIVLFGLIFFKSFVITAKKTSDHKEVFTKNLAGNKYYGFTPDWVNFLKMSEWSAKKVDENAQIGSRKPAMSFIYGNGREFYPMYRIPVHYTDSVMAQVNASDKQVYFLQETELRKQQAGLVYRLKQDMIAGISLDDVLYGVYLVEESTDAIIDQALSQTDLLVIKSTEEFSEGYIKKAKKNSAIIPDELLDKLRENNVEYVIVGNLRVNPRQKTNRTINTVARYLAAIQLKYPGIFQQVHQIGKNENEPARLYKINFSAVPNTSTNSE